MDIAARVREVVSRELPERYSFETASAGASTFDPGTPDPDADVMFRRADWALTEAKRRGEDRVVHANDAGAQPHLPP